MLTLSNLTKTVTKKSKRVGRGGNRGKNSGLGNKGQNKRAGKPRVGFEGGQKSLIRRSPKYKGYNFSGKSERDLEVLSLTILERNYNDGENVTLVNLLEKNIIKKTTKRVRIIKAGQISKKITVEEGDEIHLTKGAKEILQ